MGVINITPDSFSDGGKYYKTNSAIERANHFVSKGCKIIDVVKRSTRPGAKEISVKSEWNRMKNFLKKQKNLIV